jgi:U2-associated protein SR140
MWPRIVEDMVAPELRSTKTPGATGFVSFMNRSDAERAHREAEGSDWQGCVLRTSWGKPLRRPIIALYPRLSKIRERGDGAVSELSKNDHRKRSSRSPTSKNHRRVRDDSPPPITTLQDLVTKAKGEETVKKIQYVASRVKEYGKGFEEMLRKKEKDDPLFSFLQHVDTSENDYYQALLDNRFPIVLPVPPFDDDGDVSLYSSDTEEDSEWEMLRSRQKTKELGRAAGRRLQAMLRGITLRRERIARVMVFAIDHAAAAETVTNVIIESLLQPCTPLSRKLARLYTVSDILHNSSVSASNAWRYRSLFEEKLDTVFLHWGDVANSFAGRIKSESCKEMARNIINGWEHWLVFENSKLATWRQHIEAGSNTSRVKRENDLDAEQI